MYLLDTNVISELRKSTAGKCDKHVIAWANSVSDANLFLSVITVLELEAGILSIERKDAQQGKHLRYWFDACVLPVFSERIFDIDVVIARCCAKLYIPDPCSDRDAMIAATALVHGMTVVTRNVDDFRSTGVDILNPWQFDIL